MTAAKSALRFLSRDAVVVLHRESLSEHGGIDGIRDEGLLQSALHRCVHKSNYEPDASVIELAASLAFGLAPPVTPTRGATLPRDAGSRALLRRGSGGGSLCRVRRPWRRGGRGQLARLFAQRSSWRGRSALR